jgi:hypothetical protein
MVNADSIAAAKDGAERVAIDYQPLPAVTQAVAAGRAGRGAPVGGSALQRVDRRRGRQRGGDRGGVCARRAMWCDSKPGSARDRGPMEPRAAVREL